VNKKKPKKATLPGRTGDIRQNKKKLKKLKASLIFNKPLEQVTKEERYIAKSINFGLSYSKGSGGLQANLREDGIEIDKGRAGEYIRAFFKSYPRVSEYMDRAGTFVEERLYIRNKAGRIIRYR
jgi:DNA polymerase-1